MVFFIFSSYYDGYRFGIRHFSVLIEIFLHLLWNVRDIRLCLLRSWINIENNIEKSAKIGYNITVVYAVVLLSDQMAKAL